MLRPSRTGHPGTLTGVCAPATVLTSRSLEKSEQKISEVLEELNAFRNRERADKAAFEKATKRLESHVSSLEAELSQSRESCVVRPVLRLDVLIPSQRCRSEHMVAGMKLDYTALRANSHGHLAMNQALQNRFDDQSVTLRLTKGTNAKLQVSSTTDYRRGDLHAGLGTGHGC